MAQGWPIRRMQAQLKLSRVWLTAQMRLRIPGRHQAARAGEALMAVVGPERRKGALAMGRRVSQPEENALA
jgi:hypothetical protein